MKEKPLGRLEIQELINEYRSIGMSYGQALMCVYLDALIGDVISLHNYRPEWLNGMEIDRYYPQLRVGFEFQGGQHFFDNYSIHRDAYKKDLCKRNDVRLIALTARELQMNVLVGRFGGHKLKKMRGVKKLTVNPKALSQLAIEYRKFLKETYEDRSAGFSNKKLTVMAKHENRA